LKIEDILVPVDFSPNSLQALDFAASLVDPEGEIYLLHVVDADFVARLDEEGFGHAEAVIARLLQSAEQRLKEIVQSRAQPGPRTETMVVVGKPFAEILRVAADLDFSMIVMGMHGRRRGDIEELLFGSTAEKVLRASRLPIVCVPSPSAP
jgi:nucleotide-binding universal stress UspA family protein